MIRRLIPLACIFVLMGCGSVIQQGSGTATVPAGTITADTTWSGEILITGSITVNSGVTLTVAPGSRIKFKPYRGYQDRSGRLSLTISGRLICEGTANQPIYFTSDAVSPQNGDWSLIRLYSPSGPCRISYTIFEFGQQGLNSWQANVYISNSVFRFNNWEGVYFESYCQVTMEACQMYQNGYNGLAAEQFNSIVM